MSNGEVKGFRPLVYVVDDEQLLAKLLCAMLGRAGFEARAYATGLSAIEALAQERPQAVMLDLMMPQMNGIEVLRRIRENDPDLPVLMMSALGTIGTAVDALKLGAFDFLEKPIDQCRLEAALGASLERARLRRQVCVLQGELAERFRMVGDSEALQQVRDLVSRAAPTTVAVLITGETGVGKELVARAIHLQSLRAAEHFVSFNCAAIQKELLESELFGQERGAETGAAPKGKLQEADKGTLFLDEVADMSLPVQIELLRFLERPEVERPGSTEPVRLDVRVVAATNKNLAACVRDGTFRDDLFCRLNVVTIDVPALRERPDDIEALTGYFLDRFCRQYNRAVSLAPACQPILRRHGWPGNVRELRGLVERVVVLARTNPVEPGEMGSFLIGDAPACSDGKLEAALNRWVEPSAKP